MLLISSGCAHKESLQITPTLTSPALVEQYAYVGELHNEGLQALYKKLKNDKILINRSGIDTYLETTLNATEAFFIDYHNQHPAVNLFGTQQEAERVFQHQRTRLLVNFAKPAGARSLGTTSFKTTTVSSSADYSTTVSQSALSDKQKTLLLLVAEASDNAASSNEFNTLIGVVETRATTELPANEQATVFVVTSTARASAAYWNAHAQDWAALTGNAPKATAQHSAKTNWLKFALKCAIADAGGALGGVVGAAVSSGVEAAIELIGD